MKTLLSCTGLLLLLTAPALASDALVQAPTFTATQVAQVPAPVVTFYAPAPVVTYYAPAPVVTYYAPAPVVTYYAPAPVLVRPPVMYYRGPVVRTKVYYPGQPVRNYFKAITP